MNGGTPVVTTPSQPLEIPTPSEGTTVLQLTNPRGPRSDVELEGRPVPSVGSSASAAGEAPGPSGQVRPAERGSVKGGA